MRQLRAALKSHSGAPDVCSASAATQVTVRLATSSRINAAGVPVARPACNAKWARSAFVPP